VESMEPIAIVTVLALIQVNSFAFLVGKQRAKHGVKAPSISGDPEFERTFRIHQNTVEQLIVFIPALWLFGYYVHTLIGAGLGLVFIIARFIYRGAYLNDPSNRSAGFGIGMLATAILLVGGLVGAIQSWL
jgi:glutathione S-transferase